MNASIISQIILLNIRPLIHGLLIIKNHQANQLLFNHAIGDCQRKFDPHVEKRKPLTFRDTLLPNANYKAFAGDKL
jgi:hypothetical protein